MRSLSQKAALLIVANLLKYAVGFISPMLLVRLLNQEDYGTYQQLALITSIATGIMVLGLPMSTYYFYNLVRDRPHGRPTLLAQTQIMLVMAGVVSGLVIYLFTPLIASKFNNQALQLYLPMTALYVALLIAGEHFMHVMISQNRYAIAVFLETLETAVRVALIVGVLALGFGVWGIVVGLLFYSGARLLVRSYWLWSGEDSVLKARASAAFPKEQLAYSLPLCASNLVGFLGNTLDRMIVAVAFTPIDYAIYSVGALEIPLDVIFQASVANVLRASLPALVQAGQFDEIIRIWRAAVRKLALIIVPSAIYLFVFADVFITALFTHKYQDSVTVFRVYVCLIPLHMVVVSVVPQVFGRTRLNLLAVVVATGTNVILSLALLKWLGFLGPAVAYVISSYVGSAIYFTVTKRLLKTTALELLPMGAIMRTTLASGIALVPALIVAHLLPMGLLKLACTGIAFGIACPIAGWLCGALTREDAETAMKYAKPLLAKVGIRGAT